MKAALEIKNLEKSYRKKKVLYNVSFVAPAGKVTAVLGGNGSGKTTILRCALGLAIPNSGDAFILGKRITEVTNPRKLVGASVNRLGAHPSTTAKQHLELVAKSSDIKLAQVSEVLVEVGLADVADQKIKRYSTGMQQRLSLAVALLSNPDVLVLDEPSNGLDATGIHWLRDFLIQYTLNGGSVIVSTHQLADLEQVIEHFVLIHEGKVIGQGSKAEVLQVTGATSIEGALIEKALT